MSGANLDGMVGYRANFGKANVAGDGGYGVCMRDAFLKEADFEEAILAGVNLRRSMLDDARMQGANLRAVDLREARLDGTDLEGADLSGADLRNTDLSKTKGVPRSVVGAFVNTTTTFPASWSGGLRASLSQNAPSVERPEDCTSRRSVAERKALALMGSDANSRLGGSESAGATEDGVRIGREVSLRRP